MDTTETYIKMCEKAVEIQVNYVFVKGDFICWIGHKGKRYVDIWDGEIEKTSKWHIWLPRQDQLQEMIAFENDKPFHVVAHLNSFIDGMKYDEINKYDSMEQLWLAFVQRKLHNKFWDSEDWRKTVRIVGGQP